MFDTANKHAAHVLCFAHIGQTRLALPRSVCDHKGLSYLSAGYHLRFLLCIGFGTSAARRYIGFCLFALSRFSRRIWKKLKLIDPSRIRTRALRHTGRWYTSSTTGRVVLMVSARSTKKSIRQACVWAPVATSTSPFFGPPFKLQFESTPTYCGDGNKTKSSASIVSRFTVCLASRWNVKQGHNDNCWRNIVQVIVQLFNIISQTYAAARSKHLASLLVFFNQEKTVTALFSWFPQPLKSGRGDS